MNRLSTPIEQIKEHYPVVVVGSGYGGSIAASRLARAGQQVCLLEKGKEILPGEFPSTTAEVLSQFQVDSPAARLGSRTALFEVNSNEDISILTGCGLGGTSLINANVSIRPEPRVFQDAHWPAALRQDVSAGLEMGFERAEAMLRPVPYPESFPPLPKLQAMERAAAGVGKTAVRPPINVAFKSGANPCGVEQPACNLCGNCVTGCNTGAKSTLLMNYLPDAWNHGAEIFTQVCVRYLEKQPDGWRVYFQYLPSGMEPENATPLSIHAGIVILAAGAKGSAEILLRSRAMGLPLSSRLGENFTGNGDIQAFAYNSDAPVNGVGCTSPRQEAADPVGPCITGMIDLREQTTLEEGVVIEEGVVPGAIAEFLPEALATLSPTRAPGSKRPAVPQLVHRAERELQSLVLGPRHGAVKNTLTYLVMSHDDGKGRMKLQNGRLRVEWPGLAQQPVFRHNDALLEQTTQALDAEYLKNSLWRRYLDSSFMTVHPLGGCCMAEDASQGVVNHQAQVFAGDEGAQVYAGLYVMDGSIIPRPLGANPLLTICALAERATALLAAENGWRIDYRLPSPASRKSLPLRPGLEFTETMKGYFSTREHASYQEGERKGREENSPLEFTVNIQCDDLERLLSNPAYRASMAGTVLAPALSPHPLTATGGKFTLLAADPERVETRLMRYRMLLTSVTGHTYYLAGFKQLHADGPGDAWQQTTTLYVTLRDGINHLAPVLGKGILRISAPDFLRLATTLRVTQATGAEQRLKLISRFGKMFAGELWDTYGGVLERPNFFNPHAPPRVKRPLRAPAPQAYFFPALDGVQLRLLRYQGGSKGPVMLSHGVGVSSLIFRMDTLPVSLVEFLAARGFDVWLLDYRASIELPSSALPSTADDVARLDYPAAVAKIRQITGAAAIQALVHCYGSVSFFMAMLNGLEGVRSIVCSQVAAHLATPGTTEVKVGLHIPEFLEALGVKSLNAYVDSHTDWEGRLYDAAMALYPIPRQERCESPICHRITFMYSLVFEHEQLDAATHSSLQELFGVANIHAFEHLATLIRHGHLVNAQGRDFYMPNVQRLALPVCFIHGAENRTFLPSSTEHTYNWLRKHNGKNLYARHLIPGYGHADSILGRNACQDVYPHMADFLEST